MRSLFAAVMIAITVAACGGRSVQVTTGTAPQNASAPVLHFTNNLSEAVNVYVNSGGTDIFVQQVSAKSTADLVVQGVSTGSNVQLKARTLGGRTYSKDNVTLDATYNWQVP